MVVKPGGVAEVLDIGFGLARRNYRPLLIASAWGIIPPTIIQALFAGLLVSSSGSSAVGGSFAVAGSLLGLASLVAALGTVLASMAVTIACARLIEATDEGADLRPRSLYAAAVRRVPAFIRLGIVVVLASIPLLIIFPLGIYVYVRWLVSWVALLVERTGALASLGRSWELTRGCWWHTTVVGLSATVILGTLNLMVSGIFQTAGRLLGAVLGSALVGGVVAGLGGAISGPLTEPFSAAILVVLYYELRARREGFDLEQRARQLTASA